ncbi:MAG TPA: VOC family protein [Mycobacteriales bacterium]|jgi:predicted enzyme related to lactoylglutathione lyase|nr:VOC family protein [Mycobacteriales bacterium]
MNLTVNHCFLTVHDQDAALAFYTGVLGLEKRNDVSFDGMRWLTVGAPEQAGLEIGLLLPGAPFSPPEDVQAAIELVAKGLTPGLIFATDDCDAAFEELRGKGAEVIQEPIDQPYGRDCAFRDPSGNHLRFTQTPKS